MQESDILIIGVGAAGCACALRAADLGLSVTLITSSNEPEKGSNTSWAQGGIIYRSPDDDPALLAKDIQRAGVGICLDEAVDLLARRGPEIVRETPHRALQGPLRSLRGWTT
jgi:L-aspartate oxidase